MSFDSIEQTGERDALAFRRGSGDVDAVFTALSSRRRRFVLYYLLDRRSASPEVLADALVASTPEGDGAPTDDRHRTLASLYHRHLPKLADAGLLDHDRSTGRVELASLSDWVAELVVVACEHETRAQPA